MLDFPSNVQVCVVGIGSLQTCLYDSEVKQGRSKKSKSVQKGFVFYILFSATQERKRVESLCLKFFWCKGDASECSYQTVLSVLSSMEVDGHSSAFSVTFRFM